MAEESRKTFFSYAREDSAFVLRVVKELRAAGADVWLDQLDIIPGQTWDTAIENALRACPYHVTVLSPPAVASQDVRDEYSLALKEGKHVIPLLYRECIIPYRLERLQWVDFRTDYESGFRELAQALGIRNMPAVPTPPAETGDHRKIAAGRRIGLKPGILWAIGAGLIVLVLIIWVMSRKTPDNSGGSVQITPTATPVSKNVPLAEGSWRFVVSGDSRNCGDVVMPAIAAHSAKNFEPAFYWHLGDLRAIYKIDEDMAAEAQNKGEHLSCKSYLENAWPDFIKHQIGPFGTTRFYLGIGNHEVIPPKTREEFSREFEDWLMTPRREMMRDDSARIAANQSAACQRVAKTTYLVPRPYYHWRQDGVEFIYLDNSSGSFYYQAAGGEDHSQQDWFDCILDLAANDSAIKSVVVGMHEALPYSRANNHSMCDYPESSGQGRTSGCTSGEHVYNALLLLKEKKPVYVLASHSHFYLQDVFAPPSGLAGWIIGTAGAVRYVLPPGVTPGPGAQKDVYGYLVGTVTNGEIKFSFQEVKESDIPSDVRHRYPSGFPNWCFSHNSQNVDGLSGENTNRCM